MIIIKCSMHLGTGKTLAYLLPIIERLKREEQALEAYNKRIGEVPASDNVFVEDDQQTESEDEGDEDEEVEEEDERGVEEQENELDEEGQREEVEVEEEGEQGLRPPNFRRRKGKPRVVVLVPSRELVSQVVV